jgi:hypothetical protein
VPQVSSLWAVGLGNCRELPERPAILSVLERKGCARTEERLGRAQVLLQEYWHGR